MDILNIKQKQINMKRERKYSESWKRFADNWQRMTRPGRPSGREIEIYEDFGRPILKQKSAKILILGATPELRDMLAKYKNEQVVLVDINMEMIVAMTSLMKKKQAAEKEIWIKSDWIGAPLPENYFDAIFADCVIHNVAQKSRSKFLNNIKNWLKPGGHFITRCETITPKHKRLSLSEFCKIFETKPLNLKTINLFWEAGLYSLGIDENGHLKPSIFYRRIRKHLKRHPIIEISRILAKGGALYPLDAAWRLSSARELIKLILRHFKIEKSTYDSKINFIYPDYAPIYKLKAKD